MYFRKKKKSYATNAKMALRPGVRVVFVHLIFIQYWKLKIKTSQSWFSIFDCSNIENQKFTILIFNFCF